MSNIRVYLSTTGSPTHFPAPTFTEVTSLLLADSGVTYSAGVAGTGGQEWAAGSFSFTLKNTAGTYSGPVLLRRPVQFVVTVGASTITHRGVITDITEYRDGVRRLVVSGTDMLGLVADLEVGQTYDEQLVAGSVVSRWLLTADGAAHVGGATLSEEPAGTYGGDQSGQIPTYGTITGCPALSGGGVELEPTSDTGFCGLFSAAPSTGVAWSLAGWVRRPSGGGIYATDALGVFLSVVMQDGYSVGLGFGPSGVAVVGGNTAVLGWLGANYSLPPGPSDWYWVTLGVTSAGGIAASATDTNGTVLGTLFATIFGHDPLPPPTYLILGGPAASRPTTGDTNYWPPSHCQIADLAWTTSAPPATDRVSTLIRGHIGYPGETVQARADRLLTEAGLIPAAGTWNPPTPIEGPTLSDEPLTRRPLAEALNAALDSGGFTIHDLPASSTTVTSLGLLWPDALDGVDTTVTTYSGTRVLLASDGVTTDTSMLTNVATVTNAKSQSQVTYTDAASVATYGRRATQVTSWSQSSDYSASHASWLAHREADPTDAFGLPDLVLDVDGMVADGATATVVAMAKTGACITVTGLLPGGGDYSGVVRGLQWQQTPQGAMRVTLRCRPLRPLAYALLDDDATATLDNVILGW